MFLSPLNFSGKNTGAGCHYLLQGIFPTQGSKQHLFASPVLAGRFYRSWATREAPRTQNEWVFTWALQEQSLFSTAFMLFWLSAPLVSKPEITESALLSTRPLDWWFWTGAWIHHSLGRSPWLWLSLPLLCHHTSGVSHWTDCISALLPISMWLFLYILSCRKSVLLVYRLFS